MKLAEWSREARKVRCPWSKPTAPVKRRAKRIVARARRRLESTFLKGNDFEGVVIETPVVPDWWELS